jgi:hypothetical protein
MAASMTLVMTLGGKGRKRKREKRKGQRYMKKLKKDGKRYI